MKSWRKAVVGTQATVGEAIAAIESGSIQIALVLDDQPIAMLSTFVTPPGSFGKQRSLSTLSGNGVASAIRATWVTSSSRVAARDEPGVEPGARGSARRAVWCGWCVQVGRLLPGRLAGEPGPSEPTGRES